MKRILLLLSFVALSFGLNAQMDVYLRINHKLGADAFAMNATATNNLGNEFTFGRLQYYISEITLIHDGGTETMVPDTWILADAGQPLDMLLGNFNVNALESIRFGIGVDSAHNHLDPASYAMSHALAPKSPSMHWGWASGYRFAALEGRSGANLGQSYEIHTVEDENYFTTSVITTGDAISNGLRVDLDADYEMAMKNIDVSSGPTNHGAGGISKTVVENFRDFVFTTASTATTLAPESAQIGFELFPNPTTSKAEVRIEASLVRDAKVLVYDYMGRVIYEARPTGNGDLNFEIETAGYYLVALQVKDKLVMTKRLIVQ